MLVTAPTMTATVKLMKMTNTFKVKTVAVMTILMTASAKNLYARVTKLLRLVLVSTHASNHSLGLTYKTVFNYKLRHSDEKFELL